jgi:hypothetical protein
MYILLRVNFNDFVMKNPDKCSFNQCCRSGSGSTCFWDPDPLVRGMDPDPDPAPDPDPSIIKQK